MSQSLNNQVFHPALMDSCFTAMDLVAGFASLQGP